MTHDPALDASLEASLGRVMAPPPQADDGAQRVLARLAAAPLPPQRQGWAAAWWPSALTDMMNFAPAWPRIATLACAAVLGISIGLSGFGTRIASKLDLVTVASAEEPGANIFDTDALTGYRQ